MKLLIKQARVIDPESDHHQQVVDVLIEDGNIKRMAPQIEADGASVFQAERLHLLPGLMDVGTVIGDPGFEHREDLHSAGKAAGAGGFTAVACYPNTHPVVDSKAGVRYLKNNAEDLVVDFYPIAAISERCQGKDITEMIDMYRSGAVAFSDGQKSVQHNGMMMRALQYVKTFNGVILNHPHDVSIAGEGQLNEGKVSTMIGLKGIPNMAEELMVQRDIYLAEYTDSRLHIANISTAGSVNMIQRAKANGIKVTASAPALNLYYTDEELLSFDANLKVLPPLRTPADKEALWKGLKEGTIDFITSNHVPLEEEAKKKEFSFADFGAAALETAFSLSWQTLRNEFELEALVELWSRAPRRLLDLDLLRLQEGAPANITLFDPEREWVLEENNRHSKSYNSPFIGHVFRGAVLGIINGRKSDFFGRS